MSAHFSSDFPTWRLPDNLDLQLLHDAQACLGCRERRQVPSEAEEQAWKWFHRTYDPLLRGWVLGCHVPREDAKDCLQEVWTEVLSNLPAFASDGSQGRLCSWLHGIAHSKATNFLRYCARHPTKRLGAEAEIALLSRDAGPVADYEQHCREEAVQRILAALGQKVDGLSYRAFSMHWGEKKSIKKIAVELNVTQRLVRRRIRKAKKTFTVLCEQDQESDLLTDG
jgi:RNA polymerase sigma factor (sigma-70 family)